MEEYEMTLRVLAIIVSSNNYYPSKVDCLSKTLAKTEYENLNGSGSIKRSQINIFHHRIEHTNRMFDTPEFENRLSEYLANNYFDVVHFYFDDLSIIWENELYWHEALLPAFKLEIDTHIPAYLCKGTDCQLLLFEVLWGLSGQDYCSDHHLDYLKANYK